MADFIPTASGHPGANPQALPIPQTARTGPSRNPPAPDPADGLRVAGRAIRTNIALASLVARYVPTTPSVPTTITRPGKTVRSRDIVVEGRIIGAMHRGNAVHHYRVEGADGALYLCPPHWLPRNPLTRRLSQQEFMAAIEDLIERAGGPGARRSVEPEGVA